MTVKELKEMLDCYEDDYKVEFTVFPHGSVEDVDIESDEDGKSIVCISLLT